MQEGYTWWWLRPKRMTKKQIQEMVSNMKKTEIINHKAEKYHQEEEKQANDILKKLEENN